MKIDERYNFGIEDGAQNYPELERLYRMHYDETQARLAEEGREHGPYNPRLDIYEQAWNAGHLINFVARDAQTGEAVGVSNVYLTGDMHTGELIASEDTIFVHPDHRKGVGRRLLQFIIEDMKLRGVKRGYIDAVTDLRVEKIWKRMGFNTYATRMVIDLQE